jgi:hypothetical protein
VLRTLTIAAALALASAAAAAPQKVVVRFTGEVTVDNAAAFTQAIAARRDQVVGVSISVGANSDAEFKTRHYLVGADNDMLSIFKGPNRESGVEVVTKDFRFEHGVWVVDGFYVVKDGGMHQGVVSYGLVPTDEGAVRLNPAVTIVERKLR